MFSVRKPKIPKIPKIRQYGGVALDDDEKAALKLQPKFAIFEEIDEVEFMACTEKNVQFP